MSRKPAMDKEAFENETCLLIEVIAEACLDRRLIQGHRLAPTPEQREHFIQHSDLWVRWLYVNNKGWKRAIDSKRDDGNYGRAYVYMFVGHWADAFLANPEEYVKRHTLEDLQNIQVDYAAT